MMRGEFVDVERGRDEEFAVLSDLASQTCSWAVQLFDFQVLSQFSHFVPLEPITLVSTLLRLMEY